MKRTSIIALTLAFALLAPAAGGCGRTGNTEAPAPSGGEGSVSADFEEHRSEDDEIHVTEGIIPQVIGRSVDYVRHDPEGEWETDSIEVTSWAWEDGFILLDTAWAVQTDDACSLYSGLDSSYSGKPATLYIHFSPEPFSDPSVSIVRDDDLNSHVDISMRTSCDLIFVCEDEIYFFDDVPVTGAQVFADGSSNMTVDIGNGEEILSAPSQVTSITTDEYLSAIPLDDRLRAESSTYINTLYFDDLPQIEVTSEDIHDGIWDVIITNTNYGENRSPELSWEEVDGASFYEVIMIDGAWLHMDVFTESTSLAAGEIERGSRGSEYVGPYPPSGTHTYSVFVFALRDEPEHVSLRFDSGNNNINAIYSDLDTDVNGEAGNVLAYGRLYGNYTHQD